MSVLCHNSTRNDNIMRYFKKKGKTKSHVHQTMKLYSLT